MSGTDVFGNLKISFEHAVNFVLKNGLPVEYETRRSQLMEAVLNEVSRRKNNSIYTGNRTSNVLSGRKFYEK